MDKPIVLTIAGSDPSGGAGIQADIRSFEAMGVYGLSVITAITVQTANNMIRWESISRQLFYDQLYALLKEYPIKYVKTGMLPTKEIIDIIIQAKLEYKFQLLVDPILYSGTGIPMQDTEVKDFFISNFLQYIDILTPNANEAEILTGIKITDMNSILKCCEKISQMGPKVVIIKGGHINTDQTMVIDYFYAEGGIEAFSRERILHTERIHGTGCIFSAIYLSLLALLEDPYNAMLNTEKQIEILFRDIFSLPLVNRTDSKKHNVLDMGITPERNSILNEVATVYNYIRKLPDFAELIPEVRTNISIGFKNIKSVDDIAAIEGRITIVNGFPHAAGPIKFGVSNHTARLLLTAQKMDPEIRAVMNIKYRPEFIPLLMTTSLKIIEIRRENQPEKVRNKEFSTMEWIIQSIYDEIHMIPDIIWDCGEPEKEPMIRIFANSGQDLIEKLKKILFAFRSPKSKSN